MVRKEEVLTNSPTEDNNEMIGGGSWFVGVRSTESKRLDPFLT